MTAEQRVAAEVGLAAYGGRLTEDGHIALGDKVTSVRIDVKRGRLRLLAGKDDTVLGTYPASRMETSLADFVERFWFWKRK